jgi:hypothetical protein
MAMAGCALGLALGAKYTVLFLVPLVVIGACIRMRPRKIALWMAPGLVGFAGPWFVRNWITTGNPIFPQGVKLFGAQIFPAGESPLLSLKTTIAEHVVAGRWPIVGTWAHLLWSTWGPAVLLCLAAIAAVFLRGPRRGDRMAVASFAVVALGVYFITPYTGAGKTGLVFLMGSNIRYTLPAAFLAISIASVALPSRILLALGGASFVFDIAKMAQGYGFRTDLDLHTNTVMAAVATMLLVCGCVTLIGRRTVVALTPALYSGMACTACLVVWAGMISTGASIRPTPVEQLLLASNARSVTVIGSDDIRSLLGPHLDNTLATVSGGGAAGEIPPRSVQQLNAAVDNAKTDALVVSEPAPGVPKGWAPPTSEWKYEATTSAGTVYSRVPSKPAPTAPKAAPPPTPPAVP